MNILSQELGIWLNHQSACLISMKASVSMRVDGVPEGNTGSCTEVSIVICITTSKRTCMCIYTHKKIQIYCSSYILSSLVTGCLNLSWKVGRGVQQQAHTKACYYLQPQPQISPEKWDMKEWTWIHRSFALPEDGLLWVKLTKFDLTLSSIGQMCWTLIFLKCCRGNHPLDSFS